MLAIALSAAVTFPLGVVFEEALEFALAILLSRCDFSFALTLALVLLEAEEGVDGRGRRVGAGSCPGPSRRRGWPWVIRAALASTIYSIICFTSATIFIFGIILGLLVLR